jgi:hypothetical protein
MSTTAETPRTTRKLGAASDAPVESLKTPPSDAQHLSIILEDFLNTLDDNATLRNRAQVQYALAKINAHSLLLSLAGEVLQGAKDAYDADLNQTISRSYVMSDQSYSNCIANLKSTLRSIQSMGLNVTLEKIDAPQEWELGKTELTRIRIGHETQQGKPMPVKMADHLAAYQQHPTSTVMPPIFGNKNVLVKALGGEPQLEKLYDFFHLKDGDRTPERISSAYLSLLQSSTRRTSSQAELTDVFAARQFMSDYTTAHFQQVLYAGMASYRDNLQNNNKFIMHLGRDARQQRLEQIIPFKTMENFGFEHQMHEVELSDGEPAHFIRVQSTLTPEIATRIMERYPSIGGSDDGAGKTYPGYGLA